jgi:tetratricopeptide (TPR) repeat protein
VPRFEKLVERDPANRAIWDEMLGSAMKIRHFNLARDLLKKAVQALPESESAALHIFGAKISTAEGNYEEALRCIAMTLTSTGGDLGAIKAELGKIIKKEPSRAEARYLLGETMLRLGSEDEAIAELERCISLSPAYLDRVGQRLEKLLPVSIKPWLISRIIGEIHWTGSRRDEAMRYLESAQKGPQESLSQLGKTLRKLAALSPDDSGLAMIFARNLARTGGYDESAGILERLVSADETISSRTMEILREIIESEPGHLGANRLLASILAANDEDGGAVDALLRITGIENDAATLVETIEPFLEKYGEEPRLLVPLGALRCRSGGISKGLGDLEKALALDASFARAILDETTDIEWSKKYITRGRLLEVDCRIVTGDRDAAFSTLSEIEAGTRSKRTNVMERIRGLIDAGQKKEYYEFASQLLADGGDTNGAESILREGIDSLGGENAGELLITMGEIFENAGMEEKAAECFREVLDSSTDRQSILVRIEKVWSSRKEREIRSGLERIAAGDADAAETEKHIRTAIETGDLDSAGKMIDAGGVEPLRRKALLSRLHLAAGRVLSALAVASSAPKEDGDEESIIELLYMEGAASDLLGDHGRAAAAFSRILGMRSEYLDACNRAQSSYSRYIASQCEESAGLLVATGELDPKT